MYRYRRRISAFIIENDDFSFFSVFFSHQTHFHTTTDQLLKPKAVGIVRYRAWPICENLRSTDLLRNNIDDLELVSVVFDDVGDTGVVVSAAVDGEWA